MSKATIANNRPIEVSLKANEKYYYCSCGRSQSQPFCDGSHKGSDFTPLEFSVEKNQQAHLCQCKQSKQPPYCDGSHRQIADKQVSQASTKASNENHAPSAKPSAEEPYVAFIHQLAEQGLSQMGEHGPMAAMGVERNKLPSWDDIQIMVAQLATQPLLEDTKVSSATTIGPCAKKPLHLAMPLFVSDMSFGALSQEAKVALAKGAELASTAICSGEGGMLNEEQAANSRYLFELGSAKFGYSEQLLTKVQAFHFKAGQAAKTGIGGHLPANKVSEKIAQVRHVLPHVDAISPATFEDLHNPDDFKVVADEVRRLSGGIPIGFKMSANHIEQDIQFALDASADYIILDGRGGGTGAAPLLFRDHISVPTMAALARARRYLDEQGMRDRVSLIITGGLRTPSDFIKALALGANAVALANSAIQAIGCVGARICNTNRCPAGIATQDPDLRKRLNIDEGAAKLARFLHSSNTLMQCMARACGHQALSEFNPRDLATWHEHIAKLCHIRFSGAL